MMFKGIERRRDLRKDRRMNVTVSSAIVFLENEKDISLSCEANKGRQGERSQKRHMTHVVEGELESESATQVNQRKGDTELFLELEMLSQDTLSGHVVLPRRPFSFYSLEI
jgi:hypothetical protein